MKTISKDELLEKRTLGKPIQIVNVLDPSYYNLGLIQGSLKIPVSEIEKRAGELDKNYEVVTYCAGYHCNASRTAATKLEKLGFNVAAYEGGIQEWKQAGFPTESFSKAA